MNIHLYRNLEPRTSCRITINLLKYNYLKSRNPRTHQLVKQLYNEYLIDVKEVPFVIMHNE